MNEKKNAPSVGMVEKGNGFMPLVFMPTDVCTAIRQELTKRATTDAELAKAINDGKKTFEGCYRFIINAIRTECSRANQQGCEFSNDDTFALAEYYFKNHEITDVKAKAEAKENAKPKTNTKVISINPTKEEKATIQNKPNPNGELSLF